MHEGFSLLTGSEAHKAIRCGHFVFINKDVILGIGSLAYHAPATVLHVGGQALSLRYLL